MKDTQNISAKHTFITQTPELMTSLWSGDGTIPPLDVRRKKLFVATGKLVKTCQKDLFFFLCAACFESQPDLKRRKTFSWAVVGFKKNWELSEYEALVAASFSQGKGSSCLQILGGK